MPAPVTGDSPCLVHREIVEINFSVTARNIACSVSSVGRRRKNEKVIFHREPTPLTTRCSVLVANKRELFKSERLALIFFGRNIMSGRGRRETVETVPLLTTLANRNYFKTRVF